MKKTILYIDDIKTNLFIVESLIESNAENLYEIIVVESASEGLEVLLKQHVDIILLDIMMPEIDGFEAAGMIRHSKKTKDIPIIFITAKKDDETIENCFYLGSDYVNKPFNHVELLARISFHLKLSEKEKEVKVREAELEYEASYDALTQIYNRKMFHRLINEKILKAQRDKNSFIFIMLDIDFFKKVNDNFGHLAGDEVLKSISKIIKEHVRGSDIFARWGGEEFVLSLDTNLEKGVEIANNLRKLIAEEDFAEVGTLTCSFGITEFKEDDTQDSMTQRADSALYEAKESGRNKVCQA